jgi:acetate kinase
MEVYVHSVCRQVAGMRPALGRLDALVLTGGAVEGQRWLQSELCRRLAFLGLEQFPGARDAPVPVIVLDSQEERAIAEAALRTVRTT